MDSACFIPPLLDAQDLAGETARGVENGACLQHEVATNSAGRLPILQEIFKQTSTPRTGTESPARDIRGAQTAWYKEIHLNITKYI